MIQVNYLKRIGISAYIWLITISIILHVFNTVGVGELKLFHITCVLALVIQIICRYKISRIQVYAIILIIVTIISAYLSPYPNSIIKAITFGVVIGSCLYLSLGKYFKIIHVTNLLIPIPLFFLLYLSIRNTAYRFTGFYNDPNYLCTTLLVFLFLILQGIDYFKNKLIKFLLVTEVLILIYIATTTLSRTGLLCISFLTTIALWQFIKRYFWIALLLIVTTSLVFIYNTPTIIENSIEKIESRQNNKDNLNSAANLRYEISLRGVSYTLSQPQYLLFGMGIGSIGHWTYFNKSYSDLHIDHNTLTSCFSEQGLLGIVLYLSIIIHTIKININIKTSRKFKIIRIGVLIAVLIFSLSINQMTYLPYWWIIFFLNNKNFSNENNTYCRLR